jgi:hypothetical protein
VNAGTQPHAFALAHDASGGLPVGDAPTTAPFTSQDVAWLLDERQPENPVTAAGVTLQRFNEGDPGVGIPGDGQPPGVYGLPGASLTTISGAPELFCCWRCMQHEG